MLEAFVEFTSYISSLNFMTWVIFAVLIGAGGFILQSIIDSMLLTSVFLFAFQIGALVVNYLAMKFSITLFPSAEANLIAFSTIGMTVALIVTLLLIRGTSAIAEIFQPKVPGAR